MTVLVVGSVALDSVETPFGKVENVLGGSAIYSSLAASLYTQVNLVGVVGGDFSKEHICMLQDRGVDTRGLQVVEEGRTFRWSGRYDYDLNVTETIETQLNVFADFHPDLPRGFERSDLVFLANIDPDLQYEVLSQVKGARLTMMDTMNYWIQGKRESLLRTIKAIDVLTINEAEARMLAGTGSLLTAAKEILRLGPKALIIKKGEYGAAIFADSFYFVAPAYPLEEVRDPTGAGDTFAGGFMGYLDRAGNTTNAAFNKAIVHGTILASFTVEDFSIERLRQVTMAQVESRYQEFKRFTHFEID